jgi:hypothetical protein
MLLVDIRNNLFSHNIWNFKRDIYKSEQRFFWKEEAGHVLSSSEYLSNIPEISGKVDGKNEDFHGKHEFFEVLSELGNDHG